MPVSLTVEQLALAIRVSPRIGQTPTEYLGDVTRLHGVVTSTINTRAPTAPDDVADEAARLLAGWLFQSPNVERRNVRSAWYHSNAGEILAPFISRRAEAV